MSPTKVTAEMIRKWKGQRTIPALTAYDYPTARMLDEAGVPLLLVGDSLGMVVLGYPDTTEVTIEDMEHHVRAAARAKTTALLAADLPVGTYGDASTALVHARRLTEAGAEAVKAEGGRSIEPQARAIVQDGIPFLGHLGMLPQRIKEEGRYRVKGRSEEEKRRLIEGADALQDAGAFGVVLELVTPEVAAEITARLEIPTIGIGSGRDCDGQILVTSDLVGTFPWFTPRFVTPKLKASETMTSAVREWVSELESESQSTGRGA